MSKPNRRKEIQEKEDFQLKFQLALSANSKKVCSWLPGAEAEAEPETNTKTPSADDGDELKERGEFLNLPIISNGAGLSQLDNEQDNASSQTIGQFLSSENGHKKQEIRNTRDIRTGSKAMSALMNKMRSEKRKNVGDRYSVNKGNDGHRGRSKIMEEMKKRKQLDTSKAVANIAAEDSDEEDLKSKHISGKKHAVPQFGKKRKARPF